MHENLLLNFLSKEDPLTVREVKCAVPDLVISELFLIMSAAITRGK